MIERPPSYDLTRITLQVTSIGVMTAASLWVMLPFFAAVVWATMIVIATWPILLAVQARLGGRRGPAVAVMVVALLARARRPDLARHLHHRRQLGARREVRAVPRHRRAPSAARAGSARVPVVGERARREVAASSPAIPSRSSPGSSPT